MDELKRFVIIGIIGAFAAMLFYVEELVTDSTHDIDNIRKMGYIKVMFLIFANGVFGSVIMIGVFYGLTSWQPEAHIYFIGAISAVFAFMAKDTIRIFHKAFKAKALKEGAK